jgi:hypothetical protein
VRQRFPSIGFGLVLLVTFLAEPALAIRLQERPTWMAGVSWGFARGKFKGGSDPFEPFQSGTYHDGAMPQIHFGFKPWKHFMVGAHYEAWMIEFGEPPIKYRRSMQNLSAGLTWFPGNPQGVTGGIYLRAGGGMGWVGSAAVEVAEEEAQQHGERIDEWGYSVFGDGGYEFWISRNATLGAGVTFNYLGIGEVQVDSGWFSGLVANFNLYF